MTEARSEIFANVRRSLGVTGAERPRRSVVEARLASTPKGLLPERGQVEGEARVALFRHMAESSLASVEEVAEPSEVPGAVAAYLRDHNLPATVRTGADPRLKGMPWATTTLDVTEGASAGDDLNGVSHAFAGVAETGTLALVSGPDNPTSLNFLPDNHIVVLDAADLLGDIEAVWSRARDAYGRGGMPRVVNFVTGPSRSGDIEQTLILGAHGPRRLHVILVRG